MWASQWLKLRGGVFDCGRWERQRATLHHDDYHYRFYHYLSKSDDEGKESFVREIASVLTGVTVKLPDSAEKAFKHWPGISNSLRDLFDRAPRDAIAEPEAALARMAIEEVGKGGFPDSAAAAVRERAESVLAECAERGKGLVEKAIEEPWRLVKVIDEFIALFSARTDYPHPGPLPRGEGGKISEDEAERRVRDFFHNVRQLDRALSDIPRQLRSGSGDA